MEITTRLDGQVAVVSITGRLDGTTTVQLDDAAATLLSEGANRFILDLRAVGYVSSAGLRSILMAAKRAKAAGGGVVLFGLQPAVDEIMATAGFASIVPLCANEAEARARLEAGR